MHFTVDLSASIRPDEAFRRVLDLRAHNRVIPLTTVRPALPAEDLRPGSRFVARTGIGVLGFDDLMRVESITVGDPTEPASAVIVKEGRVIRGTIRLRITPTPAGCRLIWQQQVRLPWLPRFLQPLAAQALRRAYRRVLERLLAR